MTTGRDELVPVFIPALVALLLAVEREQGTPLTEEQVIAVRDRATVTMLPRSVAESLADARGYDDVDPERSWEGWQEIRMQLDS